MFLKFLDALEHQRGDEAKKLYEQLDYQIMRYAKLPRAVVLCVEHDLVNPPDHVDIIELSALADYLKA